MTTEELLFRAAARLVHHPSMVLLDAAERLHRLVQGDTTPFEEYGGLNTDAGRRNAIERAELELEAVLNQDVAT